MNAGIQAGQENEVVVPIRWLDLDPLGHVNHAMYLSYLEEGRNAWLEQVSKGALGPESYVVARIEIDYLSEVTARSGKVSCCCRVADLGRSSLTTEEALIAGSGETVARARAVLVLWDPDLRSSRPMTGDEESAFGSGGVVGQFPADF